MDLLLQTLANGIVLGAGYAVIALGLTLVFGILGIVNFAHGAYFTIGAYSVVVVSAAGVPYLAAVMLAVLVVAAVGLLTELTVVRRGLYGEGNHGSIIVTFALGQALVAATLLIFGPDPLPVSSPFGDSSVKLFGIIVAGQRAFIFVASLAVLAMFGAWLRYTVRGQQVLAVAQNSKGALYSGINVPVIRALSFVLGVAAAGLAGGLLAPIVTAYPTMGDAALVTSFTVVILGGLGSISGALIGAFLIGIASSLFDTYVAASWTPALGWMLVVAVLLLWPQGLRGRAQANRH